MKSRTIGATSGGLMLQSVAITNLPPFFLVNNISFTVLRDHLDIAQSSPCFAVFGNQLSNLRCSP